MVSWRLQDIPSSWLIPCVRKYLDNILTRTGPFTDEDSFMVGEQAIEYLSNLKVL